MRTIKQEHYFPIIIIIHFALWFIDLYLFSGTNIETHSDTLFFGEMEGDTWVNTHRIMGEVFSSWVVTVFAANFLMTTRAKWVERIFGGLDKMYMIHRRSGVIAVVLLILHFLFVPRDLTEFTPGKPMGFYALILILVGVIISAAPIFKRKIKYNRWINIHKLMGLFYILGIAHSLLVPTLTSQLPLVRSYVYGMAAIGIIAWFYKAFLYNLFNKKLEYTIDKVTQFNNDIIELEMSPKKDSLSFEAGQFAFLSIDGIDKNEMHPYTISNLNENNSLRFTIKALGDYTSKIQNAIKEGTKTIIQGPFGLFNYKRSKHKEQVWLAGGIGITPFLSFLREIDSNYNITLIWSVKSEEDAVYLSEINKIVAEKPYLNFVLWNSDKKGWFSIEKLFNTAKLKNKSIFICGGEVMREAYIKQLMEKGVNIGDIHYEEFSFR